MIATTKVDLLTRVLALRARIRAYLVAELEMDLHVAVDGLRLWALQIGLVEQLGEHQVQEIMAAPFAARWRNE